MSDAAETAAARPTMGTVLAGSEEVVCGSLGEFRARSCLEMAWKLNWRAAILFCRMLSVSSMGSRV